MLYHVFEREIMQDVVTCIRNRCTIDELGLRRERHADRYLKPPEEMLRLFPRNTDAIGRTRQFVKRCRFSLDELAYQYPDETERDGETAQETLERLTWESARERYADGLLEDVEKTLRHELQLIAKMEYAPYFLTVNAIVRFARSQGILCQGRGSAANSAVCFVLGVTSIDPARNDLLFERFVSEERREPPDIDIDFEHERREIVIQWIYDRYGRNHAALCATLVRYQPKGAVRDVAKAMGMPEDMISLMNSQLSAWSGGVIDEQRLKGIGLNLNDRRVRLTLDLASGLIGVPRHMSQHPGGFVLTRDRLDDLVPIEPAAMEDRQVIEWDKDDIDALKFMKVDVLALGMLTCMKRGLGFLAEAKGVSLDLATIPAECPTTYAMIRKADTLGVFQIESRAQMAMLPRMKPRTFYDLVVEVAIVRPGPIQGDMVHPYLRRREGKEPVDYPSAEMERVLGKTLGVPLFQEQAMRVAIECAGFSPSEADQLRRSMATFKFTGGVSKYKDMLVGGMVERGYDPEYAGKVFSQLEGFGSYGFPESHAASFALIAYASCWLKCHHPDIFCAALLNSQPMGFYAPAQIVQDARNHRIRILPICVNASRWDCTLEDQRDGMFAVRLGFRMARGFANRDAARLVAERADKPFRSVEEIWQRAGLSAAVLTKLAHADAFAPSLKLSRRDALFAIKGLRDTPLPLFASLSGDYAPELVEADVSLKLASLGSEIVRDYSHVGLSLRGHPLALLRDELREEGIITCAEAAAAKDGKFVRVAGLRLICQKPGSASGTMFITVEDETGIANIIVWPKKYEEFRRVIISSNMLMIAGRMQREGEVIHLIARTLCDFSPMLASVGNRGDKFVFPAGRGDAITHGSAPDQREIKVKTRNFR